MAVTTESLLTSARGFGLKTATPLQRAICRVSDGLPLKSLWRNAEVKAGFRGARPPVVQPATMIVLSAIRGAKSTISTCAAYRMSQTIDVSGVIPGDEIRIPILSVDRDSASATFGKLVGAVLSSPILRSRLVADPTQDAIRLKHPRGPIIEVKVVALAKYGQTVVSRWLGGVIFDEGPLMAGEDNVRNLAEARRAVSGRILPGGQEWIIGSPWGAVGPVYDLVTEHQGKPSAEVVVVRAPGPAMNPFWWTPKRCAAEKKRNPRAYRTNVEAEFADPEETLYPSTLVEPAMRAEPATLPPESGVHYTAAIDPATRGNAWTLVILGHYGFGGPGGTQPMLRVALNRQWVGSTAAPLNPDAVLREVAEQCAEYGLTEVYTDQWAVDALRALADRYGLELADVTIDHKNRLEFAENLRTMLSTKCLELSPDRVMRQDLVGVKKRVTPTGHTLVLPRTGDGRHCDYVPPLYLACSYQPEPPDEPEPPRDEYDEPDFDALASDDGWNGVFNPLLSRG